MMPKQHRQKVFIAAMLTFTSASSIAQGVAVSTSKLTSTGIVYLSGGVGNAEQQAMKDAMKDYNLRLTFARQQTGAYLTMVKVTIDQIGGDRGGIQVLDEPSGGPMLFAKLPSGDYQVRAEVDGQVQTRTVSVSPQGQDLVLHFPK